MKEEVLERAKGVIAGALQKRRGSAPLDLYEVRPEVEAFPVIAFTARSDLEE